MDQETHVEAGDHPISNSAQPPARKKGGKVTATVAMVCLAVSGALIGGAAVGSGEPENQTAQTQPETPPAPELSEPTAPEKPLELASLPEPAPNVVPEDEQAANDLDTVIEETARAFVPEAEVPTLEAPQEVVRVISVGKGDTLMGMLTGEGVERRDAHNAITAMSKVFSPRKLKPGQELHVTLLPQVPDSDDKDKADSDRTELVALHLPESPVRDVRVSRLDDGGYQAEAIDKPTIRRAAHANGTIESSLYEAAIKDGVPPKVLAQLIQIFSFDVDFQREVQKGDTFALLYDSVFVEDQIVGNGDIHVAEMTVRGKARRYYRFKDEHGFWDYFDEKGRSVRKALLRTPVDGARLSSRYGKRKHPVLGYTKMHRGVDFAAPTGTPIYAAGDGTVEAAGTNGGYGKYIRIRHNATYKTAYAHLSRIKVKKGKRVRQGQVIGHVGSTGRSTGPHLHYEVHLNGKQTNPLSVKLPTGKTLTGSQLAAFKKRRAELDSQYASLEKKSSDLAAADTAQ